MRTEVNSDGTKTRRDAVAYSFYLKILMMVLAGVAIRESGFGADGASYERYVQQLSSTHSVEVAQAAFRALREAGTNSFPILIAQLKNSTLAKQSVFQRALVDRLPDGRFEAHKPTIGEVCFDLLQSQIESDWPKMYRDYHVLSPSTVQIWLVRHRGLALQQLRVEAAKESLKLGESDAPNIKDPAYLKEVLRFLRKNLEEAKRGAALAKDNPSP